MSSAQSSRISMRLPIKASGLTFFTLSFSFSGLIRLVGMVGSHLYLCVTGSWIPILRLTCSYRGFEFQYLVLDWWSLDDDTRWWRWLMLFQGVSCVMGYSHDIGLWWLKLGNRRRHAFEVKNVFRRLWIYYSVSSFLLSTDVIVLFKSISKSFQNPLWILICFIKIKKNAL